MTDLSAISTLFHPLLDDDGQPLLAGRPTLRQVLSTASLTQYQLPGKTDDVYLVGVSGGADSTVTAIVLRLLFPTTPFRYVFTDTQAEASGTMEALDRLEAFLGTTIERSAVEGGLWGLIEQWGGFLPSGQARYCTRVLKVEPFENMVERMAEENPGKHYFSFVGIRADEPGRAGFDPNLPFLNVIHPLQDLGVDRAMVFKILEETVGIPAFYQFRSRSGCGICPMMRPSEMLGTLENAPDEFARAEQAEKLVGRDATRWEQAHDAENIASLKVIPPVPRSIDLRFRGEDAADKLTGRRQARHTPDMFSRVLYVAAEFFVDPNMALYGATDGTTGVWWSSLIGWSTTRGGLTTKMNHHYTYRQDTAEVFGLTPEGFNEQYRMAVFVVDLPSGLVDLDRPLMTDAKRDGHRTFTWRGGEPMRQMRQVADVVKRTLLAAHHLQVVEDYTADSYTEETLWQSDTRRNVRAAHAALPKSAFGAVLSIEEHQPERISDKAAGEATPCVACSK